MRLRKGCQKKGVLFRHGEKVVQSKVCDVGRNCGEKTSKESKLDNRSEGSRNDFSLGLGLVRSDRGDMKGTDPVE